MNGRVFKEKQKVAVVKGIYKSTNDRSYIIKMISSDEDFQQHYYLNARPEGDTWLIKLDSVSNPYRTPAVKWSVQMIADVLKK
ncbi:MAG TPA: hypothetical protein DE117_02060 [Fervidobacterium sp.]|nr:hypothetical protein [Fervidobacterium sp.]